MKFTIASKPLASALGKLKSVIARTTLPILSNCLIRAHEGKLHLSATNLDQSLTISMDAEINKDGATTLPCAMLHQLIASMAGDVSLELGDKHISTIRAGNRIHKLMGLSADEFPGAANTSECNEAFRMAGGDLANLITKLAPNQCTDVTRYTICGIYFVAIKEKLAMVATDGRRLMLYESEIPALSSLSSIIPSTGLSALKSVLTEAEVSVSVSDSCALFKSDGCSFITKLIEGNYPNYRQVIPGDGIGKWHLNREACMDAISAALLTAGNDTVKMSSQGGEGIKIASSIADTGETEMRMEPAGADLDLTIAFNGEYLCDILKAFEAETIEVDLIDERSAMVIRNSGFTVILLPIRIA